MADDDVAGATPIAVDVAKKIANEIGSKTLPKRRVIERNFAWPNHDRHLAKHFKVTIHTGVAFLYIASFMPLTWHLARSA